MSPATGLAIRPARAADRARLVALWGEIAALHASLQPRFFREGPVGEEVDRALAGMRAGTQAVLVAADPDAVSGFVHAALYDTPKAPGLAVRRRVHVEAIAVAEGARRRGVGRRLMDAAAGWGKARGAEQLLLTVWAGNAAAEAFYRALALTPINQVLGREL